MSAPNDGGPAFPVSTGHHPDTMMKDPRIGMTLRDYFAAHASEQDIAEFLPQTIPEARQFRCHHGYSPTRQWARYQHADWMLAERGRQ